MSVPWNEVKWAMSNARLGLKRDEICPGVTLDAHAESVAMFDQHNQPYSNDVWQLTIPVVATMLKKKFMAPFNGMEDLDDSLTQL